MWLVCRRLSRGRPVSCPRRRNSSPATPSPSTSIRTRGTERWLQFLQTLWRADPASIEALQEWFGHLLTPDTSQQKILLLVGPPRCGKGTIARVLKRLVGELNIVSPTLSSLGGPFGLQPLIGKTVAIISDARLSGHTDLATLTERLLSISGEDDPTVDRKHLPSVTSRLPVRFVIISNELPKLRDASGALAGRLIVLRFTESFLGREDTQLSARLMTELPSIVLWAIEGWRRLQQRGHFTQPESAQQLVQALKDLGSPVAEFVRENRELLPSAETVRSELYQRWRQWNEERGEKHLTTDGVFGRDLRSLSAAR